MVLGGGLEPPCLAAYAPQTYVSAISPPEQGWTIQFAALFLFRKGKIGIQGDLAGTPKRIMNHPQITQMTADLRTTEEKSQEPGWPVCISSV